MRPCRRRGGLVPGGGHWRADSVGYGVAARRVALDFRYSPVCVGGDGRELGQRAMGLRTSALRLANMNASRRGGGVASDSAETKD